MRTVPRRNSARPFLAPTLVLIPALILALMATLPASVSAHLSMIRQGFETPGFHAAGDQLGYSVATGDFNGDGYDDLAMGAPLEDLDPLSNAGVVCVNWGSPHGITHEGSTWFSANEMGGSASAGAYLGWAVASADLNHDGYDELIVGAPFETVSGNANAGAFYIMKGSPTGPKLWLRRTQADFSSGTETNDKFGYCFATGYLDDDEYVDLVIGSPGENSASGALIYVLGTEAGPFGSYTHINTSHAGHPGSVGEQFGYSLAVGNVMGGPEDEIITGVPYFVDGDIAVFEWGAIVVTPGSPTGPDRNASVLYASYDASPSGAQVETQFGRTVAVGKLSSGAFESVAVGAPYHDVAGQENAGHVMVIPGKPNGLNVNAAVEVLNSGAGGTVEAGDKFGHVVAAGYFWDPSDGWEDLAVGTPSEGFGTTNDFGQVQIFNGGSAGPTGAYGWHGFSQETLNETAEPVDLLGSSLAFGYFDVSGFGNLAVGAPGEDIFAGMVHVIAPWRQVYGLSCDHSIVLDCDEEIYFSQKPFDQVHVASTTKIMTVAIAIQAVENLLELSYDDVYTVPAWVADQIPGSQVPLYEGEEITLEDLLYTCLLRSGNDAAFAIADMVQGSMGPDQSVPIFVNRMNAVADIIGMDGTHFHNPAGLDNEPVGPEMGEHYSTPEDMARLSAWAMGSQTFREIAGTTVWPLVRHFPEFDIFWNCNNIFTGVLMNGIEPLTGIKGGKTAQALTTGCFSAESPSGGRSIAGSYRTPDPATNYAPDAGALVQLGMGACGYFFALPEDWTPNDPFGMGDVSSEDGRRHGGGSEIPAPWQDEMEFSVVRTEWGGSDPSNMEICITHFAGLHDEAVFDLGARNVDKHGPIVITNLDSQTAYVEVTLPYGTQNLVLAPGERTTLPGSEAGWGELPIRFRTTGDNYLALDVEIPYYHYVLSFGEPHSDPVYQTSILRDGYFAEDGIEVRTLGFDADPNFYAIFGHAPGAVASTPNVGVEPGLGETPLVRLRSPYPNPFRDGSQIGFDLSRAGEVGVTIYDVSGRLIRSFDSVRMEPGAWGVRWDGRSDLGQRSAAGAYLYHVTVDGRVAASGKLTRIQ